MHTVAPIWRVAALMIPLASLVGCDWLPVRRRIDPALYPVPGRPDPALIRGHRNLSPGNAWERSNPTAMAGIADNRPLPPLPDLVPVSPDELFGPPAPTPMLDAALVRVQTIETAVFAPEERVSTELSDTTFEQVDAVGADHLQQSIATNPLERDEREDTPPIAAHEPVEVPPLSDGLPTDLDPTETIALQAGLQDAIAFETTELSPGRQTPETSLDEQGETFLGGLLREASDQNAQREQKDELLNQHPAAETRRQIDDPSLWQTVMHLLAESETSPDASQFVEGNSKKVGRAFRVARIAFCQEVLGFDRIKPFATESFQSGQEILIYAEVEGVHYLPEETGHVSQLFTTLEILGDRDATPRWSNDFPVEDRCSRPRHDYFVGYRLALPESLTPGRYRLRLAQRDLLSGHQDVAEAAFVIVSEDE
ncbi:hypothetical protein [Tautonia rosea]|uniref:hypothetical protein n=1 Tax=Tautonia rosea TaxID=2728037 RepID=UPI0014765697|nr:hypothetical protein [Tautonia rosea]